MGERRGGDLRERERDEGDQRVLGFNAEEEGHLEENQRVLGSNAEEEGHLEGVLGSNGKEVLQEDHGKSAEVEKHSGAVLVDPQAVFMVSKRSMCTIAKSLGTIQTALISEISRTLREPAPWAHPQSITKAELRKLRDEFWKSAPGSGGQKESWDALKAASETDVISAQGILDHAGLILQSRDLTQLYDQRGILYELPVFVLADPTNLIQEDEQRKA